MFLKSPVKSYRKIILEFKGAENLMKLEMLLSTKHSNPVPTSRKATGLVASFFMPPARMAVTPWAAGQWGGSRTETQGVCILPSDGSSSL